MNNPLGFQPLPLKQGGEFSMIMTISARQA